MLFRSRQLEFPGDHAVKMAGMICRDPDFWEWIRVKTEVQIDNEKECTEWLSDYLGIQSRKELKEKDEVRERFEKLRKAFELWKKS